MPIDFDIQYPNYPIVSWSQDVDTFVVPPSGTIQSQGYTSSSIPVAEDFNYHFKLGLGYASSVSASIEALKTPLNEIKKHKDFFINEIENHMFNDESVPERYRGHAIGFFSYYDRGTPQIGIQTDLSPNKGFFRCEGICASANSLLFGYPKQPLNNSNITRANYDAAFRRPTGFETAPTISQGPPGIQINLEFPIQTVDYTVLIQVLDVTGPDFLPVGISSTYSGMGVSRLATHWVRKYPSHFQVILRTQTGSTIQLNTLRNIHIQGIVIAREIKRPINVQRVNRTHPERF